MLHRLLAALSAGAGALLLSTSILGAVPAHALTSGLQSGHAPSLPGLNIGTPRSAAEHSWVAYYDGHKDVYLNTDVSNKGQASSLGINFAPLLAHSLNASSPMYFVKGRAAARQIAVFGSEPGESDYSPLWREIWVSWKAGTKPVLLVKDDQINDLVKSGKLSERITTIVLNAPVTSVGH
jgi:hypothetical protein